MSRFISVSTRAGSKITLNVDHIICATDKDDGTDIYLDGNKCVLASMPYSEFVNMVKAEDYE